MKRLLFTLLIGVATLVGNAQISAYPTGTSWNVTGYSLPRTVVIVSVTQQREVILRGPYARYASQLLGVIGAPMSDKESYTILRASLSYTTEPDPTQIYALGTKSKTAVEVFDWVAPTENPLAVEPLADKDFSGAKFSGLTPFKDMGSSTVMENNQGLSVFNSSAIVKTEEEMASEAAQTIFKLRKRRIELITGEQGENVFGEGLKYALEEITRLEEEYVALFLGKRMVQRNELKFALTPKADTKSMVAFRFTSQGGVVAASDLTASPVTLEFSVTDKMETQSKSFFKSGVVYRVPQIAQVTLSDGVQTLAELSVPVYQMGTTQLAPTK